MSLNESISHKAICETDINLSTNFHRISGYFPSYEIPFTKHTTINTTFDYVHFFIVAVNLWCIWNILLHLIFLRGKLIISFFRVRTDFYDWFQNVICNFYVDNKLVHKHSGVIICFVFFTRQMLHYIKFNWNVSKNIQSYICQCVVCD